MIRIYFWKVPSSRILWAILHMALDRIPLKRNRSISFWKLLGTGKGETFTPRDADARRWGLLVVIDPQALKRFEDSVVARWRRIALDEFSATLQTISSHGSWSGKTPFHLTESINSHNNEVVAITRARIKWHKNFRFWSSVPPVTGALRDSAGLIEAIGIGEAPLGLQGTFSLWRDDHSLKEFAYRSGAHTNVIKATHREQWYAEELFARFEVIDKAGAL